MDNLDYNSTIKKLERPLFCFIFGKIKDEDEANDIVQDSFIKLWENIANVPVEKAKSWLFTVSNNLFINRIKVKNRYTTIGSDVTDYDTELVEDKNDFDVREIINKALSELKPKQQKLIRLRDIDGLSYYEIGELMNLNESQVKVYLFRARKEIKNKLKVYLNNSIFA